MARITALLGTSITAGALVGLAPPTATAAPPESFTITENIDLDTEEFNFTATGALCPAGTFVDQIETVGGHPETSGRVNLRIRTVYTCADGSGTFFAQKLVPIEIVDEDTEVNSGPITFHGGTGAYTTLRGHGVDTGINEQGVIVGEISGELKLR